MPKPSEALTAEQLIAAFMLDAPVPVRLLYGIYGKRSTFHVWRRKGLDVKTIVGMGPTVIPSSFKVFLLKQRGDWKPMQPPRSVHDRAPAAVQTDGVPHEPESQQGEAG